VWQKIHARNNSAQHLSTDHDYVLVYAKDKNLLTVGRVDRTELSDMDCQAPGLMESWLAGFQGCGDRLGHRV
jgi:adenine-specific DNA-methyltransferase